MSKDLGAYEVKVPSTGVRCKKVKQVWDMTLDQEEELKKGIIVWWVGEIEQL